MTIDTFEAVKEGYMDHLFDMQMLCIQNGYWSGYYHNSKHPKPPNKVMEALARGKETKKSRHVDDVNVEHFLELERRRKEFLDGRKD